MRVEQTQMHLADSGQASTMRYEGVDIYAVLAAGVGIALALAIFPTGLLFGLDSYWDRISGDNAVNWIGYEAFARDAWRWPIFRTTLLAPPDGVNILFTDPIPLMALIGKVVFKLTGWLPNYFGFWLLLAYALQPVTGYWLLRTLGLDRGAALVGGLLFLLVPTFVFRYGHFPLLGHWALLAALALHVLIVRTGGWRPVLAGVGLVLLLVLINPYLMVMAAALIMAGLGDGLLRGRLAWKQAASGAVLMVSGVVVLTVACGFVEPGGRVNSGGGFGLYSMNLLSPVVPQLSIWPGRENFILMGVAGQYEGFNYLGLGILGLLLFAVVLAWRPLLARLQQHILLCITLMGLAAYALSTQVYAGTHLVLNLSVLEEFGPFALLSGIFRSSGRFFWPLGYFLLALACYALHAQLGARRFIVLATLAILVQAVDTRPLLASVQHRAAVPPKRLDREAWTEAARSHDELLMLPQFLCASPQTRGALYDFGLIAVRLAIPTNSAIVNRFDLDCQAEKLAFSRDLRSQSLGKDPLIVLLGSEVPATTPREVAAASGMQCLSISIGYVCSKDPLRPSVLALGTPLEPEDTINLDQPLSTAVEGDGLRFLGAGWAEASPAGLWGIGTESQIKTKLAQPVCGDLILNAHITPLALGDYVVRKAAVTLNGTPAPDAVLTGPGAQEINLHLPNPGCTDRLEIAFRFEGLRSPKDLGMNSDPRPLNWTLRNFTIRKAP
ncbi:DUF6311 domain-containing protein [Roseomonas xinghualingensis]|uniref:DUF6311 domain-containing protein n=1 Tax=Roseomonas xinghualingensis TaxID=2986475 RepID=UPI0021F1F111|nr:DUF6311 domain-containing protein [Roseomonas sp. SXEYE001]MCV4208507.1 DUF6311 domain-containing protein [Roseomonas sp. SXEYE001]